VVLLGNSACSGGGIVGGIQFGDNFQYKRLALGFGADLDVSGAKNQRQAINGSA
jgi:hypothetical protein